MLDISGYVLAKAKECEICEEWAEKISNVTSVDDLLKMYVAGIDFCLQNNFPSNEDLVKLVGSKINQYGVYVDSRVGESNNPFIVLLGSCKADLSYTGYGTGQLFVKHQSKAKIKVSGSSFLVIDCFENSELSVNASSNSKILINVYGDSKVTTESSDQAIIKLVNKLKETY